MHIKTSIKQLFSTIFSTEGLTAGIMIAGAILLGVGVNTLLNGNYSPQDLFVDSIGVYADGAACNETCTSTTLGETCGGPGQSGICQDDGSGTCGNTCNTYTDQTTCFDNGCNWDGNTDTCVTMPGECTSVEMCNPDSGCYYINNAPLVCECSPESGETLCSDIYDNDGDGFNNCADSGCDSTAYCIPLNDSCYSAQIGFTCAEGAGTCDYSDTSGICEKEPGSQTPGDCTGASTEAECAGGPDCRWTGDIMCETGGGAPDSFCGTTNGITYYTTNNEDPATAGQGTLCTNGGSPIGLAFNGNTRSRGCLNQGGCSATNNYCGDSTINTADGEICEATDLNGSTCSTEGFDSGTLGCGSTCTAFDIALCNYDYYCNYDDDNSISDTINCSTNQSGTDGLVECQTNALCQDPLGTCTCQQTPAGTDCDDTDPGIETGCDEYYCDFDGDGQFPSEVNCYDTLNHCNLAFGDNTPNCQPTAGTDCLDCLYNEDFETYDCTIIEGGIELEGTIYLDNSLEQNSILNSCTDSYDNDCDGATDYNDTLCTQPTYSFYCDYDGDGEISNIINCTSTDPQGQECDTGPGCVSGQCTCDTAQGTDCDDTNIAIQTGCTGYHCDYDYDGYISSEINCDGLLGQCEDECQQQGCCQLEIGNDCFDCSIGCGAGGCQGGCQGDDLTLAASINPGASENTATTCYDYIDGTPIDNDCDGIINCNEADCTGYQVCQDLASGSISGIMFIDENGDEISGPYDGPYEGGTINLYDGSNDIFQTEITGSDGSYNFTNIPLGSYYLGFEQPSGYIFVTQDVGSNDIVDSDANQSTGLTAIFSITQDGQTISNYDAGLVQASCDSTAAVTLEATDATCGSSNGTITATFSGPTGATPIAYHLLDSTGTTINTVSSNSPYFSFTSLVGNTIYSVKVEYTSSEGASGCEKTSNQITVQQTTCNNDCDNSAIVSVNSYIDETTCSSNDGNITLLLSGDNAANYTNIQYVIQEGSNPDIVQSNNNVTGLSAGTYNIYATYEINETACTTIGNGTPPNPVEQILTCTPVNGCDDTAMVDSVSVSNESAPNLNDGSIILSFDGVSGNSNVIYKLENSVGSIISQSSNTFNNLSPDTYSAYATYTSSTNQTCDTSDNVTNPITITIIAATQQGCDNGAYVETVSVQNETVCNLSDGTIEVQFNESAGAGNTGISYHIYNGISSWSNNTGIFENLAPGNYALHATYTSSTNQACNTSTNTSYYNPVSVTIGTDTCPECDPTAHVQIYSIYNETGNGTNDGEVSLDFIGENTNTDISYIVEDGSSTSEYSSETIYDLSPGNYQAYASYTSVSGTECTTASHTSNPVSFTILAYEGPECDSDSTISVQGTNESECNGDDGTIDITHNGSGTPESYYVKQGSTIIDENSYGYFSGLQPGSYTVGLSYSSTSGNECTTTEESITISPAQCAGCNSDSTVNTTITNGVSCNDLNSGEITATYNGGGTPTGYNLMQGTSIIQSNNTGIFTNLPSGTYYIEVLYSSDTSTPCSVTGGSVTLPAPNCAGCDEGVSIEITSIDATTCNGNDATISTTLNNISTTEPITYTLVQGRTAIMANTTGIFTGLAPGTYYVYISYSPGPTLCNSMSNAVVINAFPCGNMCDGLDYKMEIGNETACNANDGNLVVRVDSTQPPQYYSINKVGTTNISTSNTGFFENLSPGTYTVEAVYSDCTVSGATFSITAATCTGGGCNNTTNTVTATIGDETTCGANNGSIQTNFDGPGSATLYILHKEDGSEETNTTGYFSPLNPEEYKISAQYTSTDGSVCSTDDGTYTVGAASCSTASCGIAANNTYSFANDIIVSEQCVDSVAGNVGRNLDYWEWQCVGITTVTCQADITDTDGDGILDPDDQCITVPGLEQYQGCPKTGTTSRRSGRGGSIVAGVCGNGSRERSEECDDGNRENFDGCDSSCEVEKAPKQVIVEKPTEMIVQKIRSSIQSIQAACTYDDVNYASKLSRFKDISWEDRYDPSYILTLYCITKGYKDKFQRTQPTGIGEAIKMITKVHAIGSNMAFNERGFIPGAMPYIDMNGGQWYTPYVSYGQNRGILQGLTSSHINPRELKALTPISPDQFDLLIANAGGSMIPLAQPGLDSNDLFDFLDFIQPAPSYGSANGRYVTRQQAAEMVVSAFPDRFKNYKYLVGNNLEFYEMLIKKIQTKSGAGQVKFIKKTIADLESSNRDEMGKTLQIDARIIIEFLKEIIGE